MIKMVVVDIDGTIMGDDLIISQNLKDAVFQLTNDDVKVVIATGRMYFASVDIAAELGVKTPIICYQGACIRNYFDNSDIILDKPLKREKALEVVNILKQENIHINLYSDDILYVESDNDIIKKYSAKKDIPYNVIENFAQLTAQTFNKVLAIDDDTQKVCSVLDMLQDKYKEELYIIRSTPYFCEVSNPEATKGKAVDFLAQMWGIQKSEIMAIGDQDNDIEMLLSAGIKVAMGNATDELKKIADFITDDVQNDGAFLAIEKFTRYS